MISEIEIAKKLSQIKDINSDENIVNSGRVQGINIYHNKLNILISKRKDDDAESYNNFVEKIKSNFSKFQEISVDQKEGELKK